MQNPDQLHKDEQKSEQEQTDSKEELHIPDVEVQQPKSPEELQKMEEESKQKDEEELAGLREKIEDIFDGKKDLEPPPKKNADENAPETKERKKAVEEALKEIDGFLGESRELSKADIDFLKNAKNQVYKLSRPLETGNPKELTYRSVRKMTESAVPQIKNGLSRLDGLGQRQTREEKKGRTEIEELLQKIEQGEDSEKVAEYTEKASQLFDELVDGTLEGRSDSKKERTRLREVSDENNDDARKDLRSAEKNIGNVKDSMTAQYAKASKTLAEFVAVESGKIDKNEDAFQKSSEERKKAFKKILENL